MAKSVDWWERILMLIILGLIVGISALWAENRDMEIEKAKTPPRCMVDSPNGIDVCNTAPEMMPLFEPETHDYVPPPP
ncbi:MAG: hypothetical protein LAP61_05710 [Acidobacteriia bacterium]|nr:hypothetical protein [Terriglobia bacterium]